MSGGTVDLRLVEAGLSVAHRARNIDDLRASLTSMSLPIAIVELLIANEIVNRYP